MLPGLSWTESSANAQIALASALAACVFVPVSLCLPTCNRSSRAHRTQDLGCRQSSIEPSSGTSVPVTPVHGLRSRNGSPPLQNESVSVSHVHCSMILAGTLSKKESRPPPRFPLGTPHTPDSENTVVCISKISTFSKRSTTGTPLHHNWDWDDNLVKEGISDSPGPSSEAPRPCPTLQEIHMILSFSEPFLWEPFNCMTGMHTRSMEWIRGVSTVFCNHWEQWTFLCKTTGTSTSAVHCGDHHVCLHLLEHWHLSLLTDKHVHHSIKTPYMRYINNVLSCTCFCFCWCSWSCLRRCSDQLCCGSCSVEAFLRVPLRFLVGHWCTHLRNGALLCRVVRHDLRHVHLFQWQLRGSLRDHTSRHALRPPASAAIRQRHRFRGIVLLRHHVDLDVTSNMRERLFSN